jgi:hypothetical protein
VKHARGNRKIPVGRRGVDWGGSFEVDLGEIEFEGVD